MLFEGWELQFTDAWKFHPFHGPNDVNGIDADPAGRGLVYNELRDDPTGKKVVALQEAYVRQVVDTVNDLDNVLYEVSNEAGVYSTKWQYHMIMEELWPSPTWQDSCAGRNGAGSGLLPEDRPGGHMLPEPKLSATGYVLALRGREYLACQDGGLGEFWIDLSGVEGDFEVQWYDATNSRFIPGKPVRDGGRRVFTTPFPGPAAVHLKRLSN